MINTSTVQKAQSREEIEKCFPAMKVLRPYLSEKTFVERINRMMNYGYQLIYIESERGIVGSAAGFRFTELLHWGKAIYIDDLTTLPSERGKGLASKLLDYILELARKNDCAQIHLDSGCNADRFDAHRLYLKKGYNITSHHFTYLVKSSQETQEGDSISF